MSEAGNAAASGIPGSWQAAAATGFTLEVAGLFLRRFLERTGPAVARLVDIATLPPIAMEGLFPLGGDIRIWETNMNENKRDIQADAAGDGKSRREAIGRVLKLAAAAPMAALIFKPGKAAASV